MTFDPHVKTADDLWDDIFTTEAKAKQAEAVQPLKLDRKAAKRFLDALHGGDSSNVAFTFQTADDNKARKAPHLARVHTLTLANAAGTLEELNRQGAAVWVTINKTDGKGRLAKNVTAVRAGFVDLDGAPLKPVLDWTLKPHIVVESSPGKFHAHYLADGSVTLEAFTTIQLKLATLFNGDPQVCDLPRVMRLPGAWHLKGAPFHTRIVSIDQSAPAYSLTDFETALAGIEIPDGAGQDKPKGERKPRKALHAAQWVNQEALHRIKDWAPHFFPGGRKYGGGLRVPPAALGRTCDEDLSIHPDGVRDFGQENMPEDERPRVTYSPLKLLMAFFNVVDGELELAEFDDCCRPQGTATYEQAATALAAALGMAWSTLLEEDRTNSEGFAAVDVQEPKADAPKAEAGNQGDDALKLAYLKLAQWDTKQIPPREWAVEDRVPMRNVFHVAGAGAVGKSLLELQRGVAHVIAQQREGVTWIGLAVRPGPVIYYGAEDDEDEIARRLADIAAHYQTTFADLERGGLHVLTYAGKDALLATPDANNRRIVATAEYGKLLDDAGKIKPVAVIIDTRNDTFGGNEIDRTQVRQYVGLLRKLAIAAGGSVSMCDHPSLAGMREDTGLSGSTAWHNSVRARAYLTKAKDDGLPGAAGDLRELRFLKNNYGREESAIRVRWQCGVFVPVTAFDAERIEMKEAAGRLFLTLLARLTNEGRNVSHKKGPTYAPALFAKQPEAQSAGIGAQAFADAMEVLFQSGRVRVEPYGKPSDHRVRLVAVS